MTQMAEVLLSQADQRRCTSSCNPVKLHVQSSLTIDWRPVATKSGEVITSVNHHNPVRTAEYFDEE